jgi:hypothetical protein
MVDTKWRVWTNLHADLFDDDDFLAFADALADLEPVMGFTDSDLMKEGERRAQTWLTIEALTKEAARLRAEAATRRAATAAGIPRIEVVGGGAKPV